MSARLRRAARPLGRVIGAFARDSRAAVSGGGVVLLVAAVLAAGWAIAPRPAAAAVSDAVRLLPHRRPILPVDAPAGAWREFLEDSLLAAGAAGDFRDVRVVTDDGEAIAYGVIAPRLMDPLFRAIGTALDADGNPVDAGSTAWSGIVRIDDDAPGEVVLVLRGTRENPDWWIETSPDSVSWNRAPYYSGHVDGGNAPDGTGRWELGSGFRWMRFVNPGPGWFAERGLVPELYRGGSTAAPREAAAFHVEESRFSGGTWRVVLRLDGPPRALGALRTEAAGGGTRRPLRIEIRDASGPWRRVWQTEAPPGEDRDGWVFWDPDRASAVRLTVEGADPPNEPLRVTRIEAVPARFRYRSDASPVWVAYGDPFALAAADVSPPGGPGTPAPLRVTLGPGERNPFYEAPGFGLRWLVRRPAILTVAMVATLLVILAVMLRSRPPRADA